MAGKRCGLLQLPFDGVAAGEHFLNVLAGNLTLELGVGHRLRSRQAVLERQQAEEQEVSDDPDHRRDPSRPRFGRFALRQPLGAPRSLRLLPRGRVGWWVFARRARRLRVLRGHVCPSATILTDRQVISRQFRWQSPRAHLPGRDHARRPSANVHRARPRAPNSPA